MGLSSTEYKVEYMGDWNMPAPLFPTENSLKLHIGEHARSLLRVWWHPHKNEADMPQGHLHKEVTTLSRNVLKDVFTTKYDTYAGIPISGGPRWNIIGVVLHAQNFQIVIEVNESMTKITENIVTTETPITEKPAIAPEIEGASPVVDAIPVREKATYILIHHLISDHLATELTPEILETGKTTVVLPKEQSSLDSDVLLQLMDDAFQTSDCAWKIASLGRPQPLTPNGGFNINIEALTLEDI